MPVPEPNRLWFKIKEEERIRDLNLNTDAEDTDRLSRGAYILIQLTVILLIFVGLFILYQFVLH